MRSLGFQRSKDSRKHSDYLQELAQLNLEQKHLLVAVLQENYFEHRAIAEVGRVVARCPTRQKEHRRLGWMVAEELHR